MKTENHDLEDNNLPLADVDANSPAPQVERPTHHQLKKFLPYLGLIFAGAGATIISLRLLPHPQPLPPALQPFLNATASQPSANSAIDKDSNFITAVVRQDGSAVVRIDSTRTIKNPAAGILDDPLIQKFFGYQLPQVPSQEIERGIGSGFIIDSNGEILTNAHVVNGADTVTVTLKDGRNFKGKVMGVDPVTDIAVVKIQADNLPTVKLGNSNQLQPGEWAIAIGNPLGLNNTVTHGIISAIGRSSSQVGMPNERVDYIQTDAPINPGNSGGPLLNAAGQVIGINTAIIQNTQGLGFAIPINTAKKIAAQLISTGKVNHPYLGIQMLTLTPEVKQQINDDPNSPISVDQSQGVLVVKVARKSPANQGGVRAGDVIVKANNQAIDNAEQLQQAVENTPDGSNLQLQILRNGQTLNLSLQPKVLPGNDK
ncbi:trypsin-like peptidase domain-containing protein [Nostoc sp. FACHB-152]|uniref:HhoA/HhoB/HtrA family serine endopeptidase n=1 Tax=unclassified Nostoc TaxID=2593658 RepID=UPI001687F208|nr:MULTISPECIES: HhoA/HhoB/HtrA family serine endopeptidase [unclassified Nostoc]MBD2452036.1 trypsin-like peptidase domain-containing protein [Nostoc sp. FACHB-152]MBD2469859.1 trypsin-like peptidase domain-containing protein [Nostoc sp. FACHB-145]